MLTQLLNYSFYNNSGRDYLESLLFFVLALVILMLIQKIVLARLQKFSHRTKTEIDDVIINILAKIKPPFYLIIAFYLAVQSLHLSVSFKYWLNFLLAAILIYEGIRALEKIIAFFITQSLEKNNSSEQAVASFKTLNIFIRIILWSIGLLLLLSNAGINITSLIAGLGIGGIAIALALQNVLGDIFSSFSILIDKPFQVGDFIKIGADMGTVEKIGIKTTRLRTLDGQILVVANQELTTARVENFHQAQKRRALFTLGLIYQSSREQLEKVPDIIKSIVASYELAEFDRCHFKSYGDFSLNFEVSFYVKTDNYQVFLDVLEKINLDIFSHFQKEGIEFAYPTQLQYNKNV